MWESKDKPLKNYDVTTVAQYDEVLTGYQQYSVALGVAKGIMAESNKNTETNSYARIENYLNTEIQAKRLKPWVADMIVEEMDLPTLTGEE